MNVTLVDDNSMKNLVDGGKSIAHVMGGTATQLTNEALNLFIIESSLAILKFAVVFVIFFIVKKYCDTMMAASGDSHKPMFKAFKVTALVLSLIFFTTQSFPHVTSIAKAIVAPHIFLAEKAASMVGIESVMKK